MSHFKSINFYQKRPNIKLVLQKQFFFESSGLRHQILETALQISGYAPESNHVFTLLISMPPKFSLMPRLKSINVYQKKPKIKLILRKTKIFLVLRAKP